LEFKTPISIISFGGSFGEPAGEQVAYGFNVSRWLDSVLSAADCDVKRMPLADVSSPNCAYGYRNIWHWSWKPFHGIPLNFSFFSNNYSALFCYNADDHPSDSDMYRQRGPSTRPLQKICDNTHDISKDSLRQCNIFRGSGKYVHYVNAAMGGTTTRWTLWASSQFFSYNSNGYDIAFWDHGI
jgi:hypothetical protein